MGALKTVLLIMRRASLAQGLMVKVRDAQAKKMGLPNYILPAVL